ncbi:diacylglycerol kinase family protein [Thalassoglobus polymorphus]|uniref:diacylglycerol kinase family protein n=1 Tax=Thalassoglobus polymorphus TaxID=2527994 RepID=UPI0018D21556|nr:diacylglycerol kinase family protein [Thalassoglobus polymorphus]
MKNSVSLYRRFATAIRGVLEVSRQETSLQIQWVMAGCVVVAGCVVRLSYFEWAIIVVCIGAVLSAEIMNSAIEETVDLLSPEKQEGARKAKDFAAGSVFVIAISSAVVGLFVFGQHLWDL